MGGIFISNPFSLEDFLLTLLTNENILTLPTRNGGEQGPRAGVATRQTPEATACAAGRPTQDVGGAGKEPPPQAGSRRTRAAVGKTEREEAPH